MRIRPCLVLVSMTALLMAGCSVPIRVALFNNTSDTINVIIAFKGFVVPASSQIRFEPGIDEHTSFLIEMGGRRFAYWSNGPIPNHFWGKKRKGADLYYQLQGDAKVYLVRPDTKFPVVNFPEQPEGLPLTPVRTIELE